MLFGEDIEIEAIRAQGFPYPEPDIGLFEKLRKLPPIDWFAVEEYYPRKEFQKLANAFMPHMYNTRVEGARHTALEAFYDDKLLRRAIRLTKKHNNGRLTKYGLRGKLLVVAGTQVPSNFWPDIAKRLIDQFAPDGVVYDFCAGYGGRLVGFLASRAATYIATDVNSLNYKGYEDILNFYPHQKQVNIYKHPAEEMDKPPRPVVVRGDVYELKPSSIDFAFTSPPYFAKEYYSDDPEQSYKRYPKYRDWLENFLFRSIDIALHYLKPDRYLVLIVDKVRIDETVYDIPADIANTYNISHIVRLKKAQTFFSHPDQSKDYYESMLFIRKPGK